MTFYTVALSLKWMHGGSACEGKITQRVLAENERHAIVRVVDRVRVWFREDITDVEVSGGN